MYNIVRKGALIMTVVKKSGKKEEFSDGKLSNSIKSANTGTDELFNVASLIGEFQQIVHGKKLITTRQIDIIVYGLLYSKGLMQTLMKYISYDKK